jgi:ATP-dependent Clp protease ATP-binding subunit ClpC
LLDEIEKAHPQVFNILLQVFEDGILSDGLGNTVDFKHTILILTSNIGARHIEKRSTVGFSAPDAVSDYKRMRELVLAEVKKTFNPEFVNRLDEVIVFNALGDEELLKIVRLMVEELNRHLQESGILVQLTDAACRWFVATTCKDRSYGARPLRRALQEHIEDPLAEEFIRGGAGRGGVFTVDVLGSELVFQSPKTAPKVAGKL